MKIIKYINKILPSFKKQSDVNNFKNILVVSNTGLGDTILGIPAIKSLRKSFPDIRITFLVNKKMFSLFDGLDFVDDYLLYERGFFKQLVLIKQLRKKKIDTVFLFHSNGPEDIFFSVLSGASNILKMTDKSSHEYESIFLNKMTAEKKHIIERKLDLVRVFNPNVIDLTMELSKKFENQVHKIYEKENCNYIGFQLGAQDTYKIWPIEKFIALAKEIFKTTTNTKIVLLGATSLEKEMAHKLEISINNDKSIINMVGKSAIDELPSLINGLDLLVTNDTGAMHMAIALKVPTVPLFGPTDSKIYGPYQDFDIHKVIQKNGFFVNNVPKKKRTQEGINLISVDEVYKIVTENGVFKDD